MKNRPLHSQRLLTWSGFQHRYLRGRAVSVQYEFDSDWVQLNMSNQFSPDVQEMNRSSNTFATKRCCGE